MLFEESIAATVILSGVMFDSLWLFLIGCLMFILVLVLGFFIGKRAWRAHKARAPRLERSVQNPLVAPNPDHSWENQGTFNPAAICVDGRIHLFYRALGDDGVSRIGHCSSEDGIHFDDRLPYPAFVPELATLQHAPHTSPARLQYDRSLYASGGGWGGCEDPRAVVLDDAIHLTFSSFNGWDSIRMTHTSLHLDHLRNRAWHWTRPLFLSPQNSKQKNWVIFPEKIAGKFAVIHGLSPFRIDYLDTLDELNDENRFTSAHDHGGRGYEDPARMEYWDKIVRGAGAPPLRTDDGWLLFYQSLDKDDPGKYKVGVMLLDSDDPSKILYRSSLPILAPERPYENDWKPGVVYASGAVVKDGTLFVYYGGGDKTVNVATAPLDRFLNELKQSEHRVQ